MSTFYSQLRGRDEGWVDERNRHPARGGLGEGGGDRNLRLLLLSEAGDAVLLGNGSDGAWQRLLWEQES